MAVERHKRIGSLCAIEVEGLKRRPPTEVGGLGPEFKGLGFGGLGFRVEGSRVEGCLSVLGLRV